MTTLTYRGKTYTQSNNKVDDQLVKLTYRKNVYINRKLESINHENTESLKYRGIKYKK